MCSGVAWAEPGVTLVPPSKDPAATRVPFPCLFPLTRATRAWPAHGFGRSIIPPAFGGPLGDPGSSHIPEKPPVGPRVLFARRRSSTLV